MHVLHSILFLNVLSTLHDLHLWEIFAVVLLITLSVHVAVQCCCYTCLCVYEDVCTWCIAASSVEFVVSYRACQLKRIIGLSSRRLVMTGREGWRGGGWRREGGGGRQSEAKGERGADKSNRPFAVEPLGASGQRTGTQRGTRTVTL